MNDETIFAAAIEMPPEDRASYLDEACAGNLELRKRIEVLIASHEGDPGFLCDPPTLETDGSGQSRGEAPGAVGGSSSPLTISATMAGKTGDIIGRYKLLQQIGEGGFGVVYLAEQTEPVKRKVALKVIKPGMDSKEVIARFEAERQAVALMEHPNIAKVHDAGTTENGRPYFVMELVKGIPITKYCEERELGTKERLELFADVCSAVQHAHQKGIIHRDLKPNNVLVAHVEGRAVPKVIDFGIAKAMHQRLTDKTLHTTQGQFLGTPGYMSPEQAMAGGLEADTTTDIYTLGVMLYELLTGVLPLELRQPLRWLRRHGLPQRLEHRL
jgi:serine/threonine protein kinase